MQPMWQFGTLGKRMSTKIVTRLQRRWKRKQILEENDFAQENGERERRISAAGALETPVNNAAHCLKNKKAEAGAQSGFVVSLRRC